jgi:dienelactone hydrolase
VPPPDEIEGFRRIYAPPGGRWPWPVYVGGDGPPVVLIHEVMGLTPPVLAFGRRLVEHGFTVYLPAVVGPVPATTLPQKMLAAWRICVSREINVLRTGATSPVVAPLRDLARYAARAGGGSGVGVIGMCFSGGFALALAADERVLAGVVAEPALPFALPCVMPGHARDLGVSREDLDAVRDRLNSGDVEVYATRFSADWISPPARLRALREALGDKGLTVHEEPSGKGDPDFTWRDHSVLSMAPYAHSEPGPAHDRLMAAADDVVAFLHRRLG